MMEKTIEIDVTPKWWKPIDDSSIGAQMTVLTEIYMKWLEEPSKFSAGLIERSRRESLILAYNDRVVVRASEPLAEVKPFCDALMDRLSSPDIQRKVLGRIALMAGDGERAERHSDVFGKIFVTSRPELPEVVVEWTDLGEERRMLLRSKGERALFGLEERA